MAFADEMDVLWSKEKLQKIFSKDSLRITATHASGDGGIPNRSCRLCGGDLNLHYFGETYIWEGVEERYDQLLYDCFGIRAQPNDGMICERCIRQLRNTQRFRALVIAAFAQAPSDFSINQSQIGIGEGFSHTKVNKKLKKQSKVELSKKTTRTTIDNGVRKRKSIERKKPTFASTTHIKRMNIACTFCKQKYPMIVPFEGWRNFVCSRCKKNREPHQSTCRQCKVMMPSLMMRDHLELHAKADLRRKSRLNSLPKKSPQIAKNENYSKTKIVCSQSPKKYISNKHLPHVEDINKTNINYLCSVCGKDMKTRDLLEKHLRTHTGQPIYQCDVCMKVFKGKRLFQIHYLTHGR